MLAITDPTVGVKTVDQPGTNGKWITWNTCTLCGSLTFVVYDNMAADLAGA